MAPPRRPCSKAALASGSVPASSKCVWRKEESDGEESESEGEEDDSDDESVESDDAPGVPVELVSVLRPVSCVTS